MGSADPGSIVVIITEKTPRLCDFSFSSSKFLESVATPNSSTAKEHHTQYIGLREFAKIDITTIKNMAKSRSKTEDIKFVSGNPLNEQTEGIVHIYTKASSGAKNSRRPSEMLCILGIPCSITVKDLLSFIRPMSGSITELKIVKCHLIGHYMALLKFKSEQDADEFYDTFNGSSYNSFEPDVCQITYVSHVEAITQNSYGSCGASFPLKSFVELPSCPVCLEKLDEPVSDIITTILCNHSFHGECISKTTDTVCPVCRYVQSPELQQDSQCADCDLRDNLWICLICGNLGCGRYGHKHAYGHFIKTGHNFALELGKNMVWDYADDAYVHRIAVNHADGKLVQVGEGGETGDKKADRLCHEFTSILVSQLESQRQFFEAQLETLSTESEKRLTEAEAEITALKKRLADAETKVASLSKENKTLSQKLTKRSASAQRLEVALGEERALVAGLSGSQSSWAERAARAEAELATAREQLHDLLLNLDVRDRITQELSAAELAESELTITETRPSRRRRRKNR